MPSHPLYRATLTKYAQLHIAVLERIHAIELTEPARADLVRHFMEFHGVWRPIEEAPTNESLIVCNDDQWTLARKVEIEYQTLQWAWPPIISGTSWHWVFANTRRVEIDFVPTHFLQNKVMFP